jgi:hypothetical protein
MADDPKDPRFLPFRRAAWAIYFAFAIFVAGSITFSVIFSTLKMSPPHFAPLGTLEVSKCVEQAQYLFGELDKKREDLSSAKEVRVADEEWTRFRLDWLTRERELEAKCVGESDDRKKLAPVFKTLQSLMNLYTTNAVQYAGEIGPSVDKLRKQLEEAKR